MHIELLVEDLSTEVALNQFLPRIVPIEITFAIHSFQGRPDLLMKLPDRLKGYRNWMPDDWRIVVVLDRDDDDCKILKAQLEQQVYNAGLHTRSMVVAGTRFQVLIRLAIEELEAWFFGDGEALCAAYPRLSPTMTKKRQYRDTDAIQGGTWEALERELKRAGYYVSGLNKIDAARRIATHMHPERNRSRSFQIFCQGLHDLINV